jgi:hypothetical protein
MGIWGRSALPASRTARNPPPHTAIAWNPIGEFAKSFYHSSFGEMVIRHGPVLELPFANPKLR